MRVWLKMNGNLQVDEIVEFEVQENGDVILYTPGADMLDIVVHGMESYDIDCKTFELFAEGRCDLRQFTAEYASPEEEEEETEPDGRQILCVHCLQSFVIPDRDAEDCFCPMCGTHMDVASKMMN